MTLEWTEPGTAHPAGTDPPTRPVTTIPAQRTFSGDPAHLRAFSATTQEPSAVEQMVMLLDMQDAAASIRRLRQWAVELAAPTVGETVVDVGSGTGTMVRQLSGLVGAGGSVVGVEPNPALRDIAVERSAAAGSGEMFIDGTAGALPFADDSVDLLWCERVLQHLADPQGAVTEFARVLRPGGRAVLLDSDHASRVTSDLDLDVEATLNQAFLDRQPNPRAARFIPRQVARAGLVLDDDIGSSALVMPPAVAVLSPLLMMMTAQAAAEGRISRAEADEAVRRHRAAAAEGVAFSAVTVFGFVARKPPA